MHVGAYRGTFISCTINATNWAGFTQPAKCSFKMPKVGDRGFVEMGDTDRRGLPKAAECDVVL